MGMFTDAGERFMGRLEGAMLDEMEEEVKPEAERRVPVRTGKLRDSIDVGVERQGVIVTAYIEAGEDYAPFVEMGMKDRPAKPFLRPSVEKFDLANVAGRLKDGGQ